MNAHTFGNESNFVTKAKQLSTNHLNKRRIMMTKLFENEDLILYSTGHDYDFVGVVETKTDNPLTFFFSEILVPHNEEEELDWTGDEWDDNIDENETELLAVFSDLEEHKDGDDTDETQEIAFNLGAQDWLRTRDDKSTGFLSCPKQRGWFLALIRYYCPEKRKELKWAS